MMNYQVEPKRDEGLDGGLHILIVDDNLMIQQMMELVFSDFKNYHLMFASNGKLALEALERNHFDLILMDLHMPVMNGFETTARIRRMEMETGEHIPILAITGYPSENGRGKCLLAGMDDYLPKPFELEELFGAIQRLTYIRF
jgi:osomolarity two-component system sensor histidine kinase NIK1